MAGCYYSLLTCAVHLSKNSWLTSVVKSTTVHFYTHSYCTAPYREASTTRSTSRAAEHSMSSHAASRTENNYVTHSTSNWSLWLQMYRPGSIQVSEFYPSSLLEDDIGEAIFILLLLPTARHTHTWQHNGIPLPISQRHAKFHESQISQVLDWVVQ